MYLNGKNLFAVNYKVQKGISMENIIIEAYEFEVLAIIQESLATNPYYHTIKSMKDGDSIWEAIEFAVFLYFKYFN